jgi:RHS repeat-associated protein
MSADLLTTILIVRLRLQRTSAWLQTASRCIAFTCMKAALVLLFAVPGSASAVTVAATLKFPYRGLLETQVEQVQAFYFDWAAAYPWAAANCSFSGLVWSPATSTGYYDVYVCPDLSYGVQPLPVRLACPPSFTLDSDGDTCTRPDDTPDFSKMAGKPCTCEGDPIDAGSGNSYQVETDYIGPGSFPLRAIRFYNSGPTVTSTWGSNWRGSYDRAITVSSGGTLTTAYLRRHDGRVWAFNLVNGHWIPESDVVGTLTGDTTTGWTYTNADSETEKFTPAGKLLSISDHSGQTQKLSYNANGLLATVTDSFGHQISFSYDSFLRVTGMIDSGAQTYSFEYSGASLADNLTKVTFPDQKSRTYVYGEPDHVSRALLPHALTGLIDENGDRFATWHYDARGRAISSENSLGIEKVTMTYNADGTTSVTDAQGGRRSYQFQTVLGVTKSSSLIRAPDGATQQTAYDTNGNIASRSDFNGNQTTYAHDPARNLETSRVEATGTAVARTISTQWHATYRLPTKIAEPLRITSFSYDSAGNLLGKSVQATSDTTGAQAFAGLATSPPRVWATTYNAFGQVQSATEPGAAIPTSYNWDASGNLVALTDALGQTTTLSNYDANGRVGRIVDAAGRATDFTWHPRGWLTSRSVSDGDSTQTTTYDYDGVGQLTRLGSSSGALQFTYDAAHRLTAITDALGNHITYTLDAMGNRVNEQVSDPSGTLARQTTRSIDALNRLQQIVGIAQYQYDPVGNLTRITDPLGHATDQRYDALNRLVQTLQPAPVAGTARPTIQMTYDGLDQLQGVVDPRKLVTTYTVDGLGNQTAQRSPDSGNTTSTQDPAGRLASSTDARGITTTMHYDALGRVTDIAAGSGTPTGFRYGMAQDAGTVTATGTGTGTTTGTSSAAIGQRIAMTDESGQTTYTWGPFAQLLGKTQTVGSGPTARSFTVAYAWDNQTGQLTGLTYPGGERVNIAWDAANHISGLTLNPARADGQGTDTATTIALATDIAWQPFGPVRGWNWGNAATLGTPPDLRGFDLLGRVTGHAQGGLRRDFTLDEAGRIRAAKYSSIGTGTSIGAIIGVAAPANLDQAYSYDDLDRLTGFIASGISLAYQYDASGNRIQTGIGGNVTSHAIDPLSNRLLASSGPAPAKQSSYDAAGNLLSDGSTTFTYSDRGRLQSVSRASITTSYLYNGLGQRVVKHSGAASGTPPPGLPSAPPPLPANCSHASQLQRHAEIAQYKIDLANEHARITAAVATAVGKVAKAQARLDGQQNIERIQAQITTVKQSVQTCHDALVLHAAYRAAVKAAKQTAGGNTGGSATDAVTYYVYDEAGHLLGEYDAAGKVIQQTVYLGDVPVAVLKPESTGNANGNTATSGTGVYYIHTDQLDAPRVITRATDNAMVWRWDQADPYGVMQPEENLGGIGSFTYSPRFPGQLYDRETGLHYNHNRDYDPSTGRYVQSDPIALKGGINTYAYAGGNPVGYTDPLGLNPVGGAITGAEVGSVFGPAGTVVGGVVGAIGVLGSAGTWLGRCSLRTTPVI